MESSFKDVGRCILRDLAFFGSFNNSATIWKQLRVSRQYAANDRKFQATICS